MPGQMKTRSP